MIASMIIVFREVLEMALVLGVLLAATQGARLSRRWIGIGVIVGLLGAVIIAVFMGELESSMEGDGEFLFNAIVLASAALLIAWTVIWMAQHGRELTMRMKQVGQSVAQGELPGTALFVVSLAAVMREGSEAVFFLFGAAQVGQHDGWSMLWGGLMGLAVGLAVGLVLYRGLISIPVKHLFLVVGGLLTLLAAGMASQSAAYLIMIDMIPPIIETVWDTSSWLSMESIFGELLHILMGYDDRPSAMQLIVFVVFVIGVMALKYRSEHQVKAQRA